MKNSTGSMRFALMLTALVAVGRSAERFFRKPAPQK